MRRGRGTSTVEVGDDPARPARQQHDPVAEADRLADVVGDEEHGQARVPPEPFELVVEQVTGDGVEGAEGLVHQQESASWARARASATRWRIPPDSSWGRLSAKAPRWTISSSSATRRRRSALGDLAQPEGQLDVAGHGQPGKQGGVLEHQGGVAAGHAHGARRRAVEPGDQVEQGALAAARRAHQADELAGATSSETRSRADDAPADRRP